MTNASTAYGVGLISESVDMAVSPSIGIKYRDGGFGRTNVQTFRVR